MSINNLPHNVVIVCLRLYGIEMSGLCRDIGAGLFSRFFPCFMSDKSIKTVIIDKLP